MGQGLGLALHSQGTSCSEASCLCVWASVSSSDAAGTVAHCLLLRLVPKEIETKKGEERGVFFFFWHFVVFQSLIQDIMCSKLWAMRGTTIPPILVHKALRNTTLPMTFESGLAL